MTGIQFQCVIESFRSQLMPPREVSYPTCCRPDIWRERLQLDGLVRELKPLFLIEPNTEVGVPVPRDGVLRVQFQRSAVGSLSAFPVPLEELFKDPQRVLRFRKVCIKFKGFVCEGFRLG